MSAGCSEASTTIDDLVQAYELARATDPHIDVASFFPAASATRTVEIVELLRVDLEYAWRDGIRDRLEQHVSRFGALLNAKELAEVAYEDYRLRRLHGEAVSRASYTERYAVGAADWPELPVGKQTEREMTSAPSSWLESLSLTNPAFIRALDAASREMPQVGQQFDQFELVAELGTGAFGKVFLARQESLAKRFVALKVTSRQSDEPQYLAQLQHTNIVPIYSLHHRGTLQTICMPYLGANTLADLLRTCRRGQSVPLSGQVLVTTIRGRNTHTIEAERGAGSAAENVGRESSTAKTASLRLESLGRMSYLEAVVWLFVRLTDGLAYAHDHGIVHRDLKPANVLLGDDGQPLLLDFHIATSATWPVSTVALAGGTLPYMAPECLRSLLEETVSGDRRSDIYSLGVMLYELLTGELPHPVRIGQIQAAIPQMLNDRRALPRSPRWLNPAVSPALAEIILRCLAEQPSARYANAHELQEDLQRHLENQPLRYASNRSPVERIQKWCRRHPRLSSASSVLSISLLVFVFLAASWLARGNHLAAAHARETLQAFFRQAEQAAAVLDIPDVDEQILNQTVADAQRAVNGYGVARNPAWRQQSLVTRLNDSDQAKLAQQLTSVLYLVAAGQGQQAVRADDASERQKLLESALQNNSLMARIVDQQQIPQAARWQRQRLQSLLNQESFTPAPKAFDLNQASSLEDRYLIAVEWTQRRQWAEAAELLEQLTHERPSDYKLWLGLGICQLENGYYAAADGCFSTAIALRPELYLGYFYRGTCRIKLKQWPTAEKDCSTAMIHRPQAPAPYINRAIARQGQRDVVGAIEDLTQAINLGTTETRVYFLRSKWKDSLGDKAGAAADREAGMHRAPRDEVSWVARALARLNDDLDGATSDCEAALRLNPSSQAALQNLAFIYGEKKAQPTEAIAMLNRLAPLTTNPAEVLASRGVYHARLQHRESALRDASAALERSSDALTNYRVACIHALLSVGEPNSAAQAVAALALALQKQPSLGSLAERDSDLKPLYAHEQFHELVAAARQLTNHARPKNTD